MLGQRRANAHTLGGTLRRGGPWGDPRGARASRAHGRVRAARAHGAFGAARAKGPRGPKVPLGQRARSYTTNAIPNAVDISGQDLVQTNAKI